MGHGSMPMGHGSMNEQYFIKIFEHRNLEILHNLQNYSIDDLLIERKAI